MKLKHLIKACIALALLSLSLTIFGLIRISLKIKTQKETIKTYELQNKSLANELFLKESELSTLKSICKEVNIAHVDTERVLKNCLEMVAKCTY